jgi:hypothetical protein
MNALKVIRLRDELRANGHPDLIDIPRAVKIYSDYDLPNIWLKDVLFPSDEKIALLTVARNIVLKGRY